NWVRTGMLMAAIVALFGVVGAALGGQQGMLLALGFAVVSNFFAYWFSDKLVLRMYRAREVDETSAPQFYNMVRELAQRAGLPMPRVYLIDEPSPNAFATGRNPQNAAVAATTGILRVLTADELRGVMAHELAHVKHRDILTQTISATMAGAISALANFAMFFGGRSSDGRPANPIATIAVALLAPLAAAMIQMALSRARELDHVQQRDVPTPPSSATMAGASSSLANFAMFFGGRSSDGRPANRIAPIAAALLAPLAAAMIQLALSRAREYEADRGGAEICGDPQALASALDKIQRYAAGTPLPTTEAHPETAQMMIMNPLSGGGVASLFSTHPPT